MKKTLGFRNGLSIEVKNQNEIKHAGLGSSSRLISAIAAAINELYGNPISKDKLVRFLAQNHGEETPDPNKISPVQCMGGSASAGLIQGGLKIITGDSQVIKAINIEEDYKLVIAIPRDYVAPSADKALQKELQSMNNFIKTGKKYGPIIAYRLVHEALPALNKKDLSPLGDLIYDYRFRMGSIRNCSFLYPKLVSLSKKIAIIKNKNTPILALSSVGPSFFALTKNPEKCAEIFEENKMQTLICNVENEGYSLRSTSN